ncbi:MAG: hypothetical protein EBV95_03980 [Actinobacteria bacterium]|nr:hypothetical protein [Actinomycetota bacterium]
MKSRYNDGGKLPPAEEAVRTAVLEPVEPAPMSEKKRMEKLVVGKASDLTPAERRKMVLKLQLQLRQQILTQNFRELFFPRLKI